MNVEPEHEPPPPYTDRNESLLNTVALSTAAAPLAVSQRSTDSRTELPNESLSAAPHSPPQNHSSQTDCPQNGQVAVGSHGPPSVRRIPSRYHVATSTARNQRSLSSSSNFASSSGSGAFVSHLDAVPATSPTGTGPHVSPPNGHRGTVKSLLAVPLPDCLNLLHGVLGFTQCSLRGLIKVSLAKPVAADSISLKVRLVGVERAYLVGSVNGSSSAGSTSIPALSDADREFGLGELIWSEPRINSSDTSGAWAKFSSKFRLSPSSPSHSPHGSAPVRERNYCSFPHLSPSKNAAVVYERTISVSVPRPEEGTVTLEAGDYEYPFLFDPLPDWLPGTFHGSQSSLVYTLEVVLNATTAISKAVATKRTDPAPSQDRTSDDRIQLQAYTSLEVPIPRFHTSLFKTPVPNGTSYPREKHNYIPATSPQTEKSNARTNNHAIEINFPPAEAGESIPWSPNGGVSLNGHTVPSPTYTAEITVQPPHSPVAAFRDDSTVISNHQTESPIRFTCLLNTRTVRFEKGVQILIHLSKVMPGYHIVGVEASIVQVLEVRRWTGSSQQSLGTPPQSKSNRNSFGAPSLSHKIYESVLGITADSPKCSADYFNKTIFIPCSRTRDAIPTMGEDEEIFPDGLTGDSGALSGLGIEGVGLEDDGVPSANPRRKVLRTMTTVRHEIRLTWRTTYSAAPASASFSMSEATSPPSPRPQSPLSLPSPILFNHKPIKASGGSGGGVIAAANGGSPVATPWKRELAVEAFRAPIVVHGLSDEMIEIIEGFLSDESVEGGWRSRLQRVQFVAKSMVLQVTHHNNVKIYSVTSAGRSALPDWLAKRKAKSLKKDQEYRSRIELIQDFQFPEASLKLKYTPDGNYIMATGVYKPQIRVYDLQELSMKFDRHTDCENVAFEILTDDWQKSIHLQLDRSVEIHAQYGLHYKTRIPKFGRELKYHAPTCDVYFAAASPEIYRLNLEQGRFLSPFVSSSPSLATLALSDAHGLLAAGGDDGCVEFWNPEDRKRLSRLNVAEWLVKEWNGGSSLDAFPAITALSFHPDGLKCSVGVASGHVLLYDLRKPVPTLVKEHPYQLPIKYVGFHPSGRAVSADAKVVRFWNKDNGELFTSIEPPYDINDVAIPGDTGLVAIANEGVDIQTFYVPELGPAPRWCSFLDNLTEELEENPNGLSMYDDYKFLSRKELARLGLDQLIGTNLLKAYMHGFFVDLRLYQKAKAIADPFEYAEHRRKLIEKKLEQERKTRIHSKNKLPRVNARLAQRLMKSSGETDAKKKKAPMMAAIQSDDRFAGLFQDAEFEIDEDSSEFRIHNSSAARPAADRSIPSLFEKADDEDISEDESGDDEEAETQPKSKRGPTLYELKSTSSSSLPLKQRLASESTETSSDRIRSTGAGNKSLTFTPGTDRNKRFRTASRPRPSTDDDGPRRVRRGVKELGLKRLPGPGVFKKRK